MLRGHIFFQILQDFDIVVSCSPAVCLISRCYLLLRWNLAFQIIQSVNTPIFRSTNVSTIIALCCKYLLLLVFYHLLFQIFQSANMSVFCSSNIELLPPSRRQYFLFFFLRHLMCQIVQCFSLPISRNIQMKSIKISNQCSFLLYCHEDLQVLQDIYMTIYCSMLVNCIMMSFNHPLLLLLRHKTFYILQESKMPIFCSQAIYINTIFFHDHITKSNIDLG